MTDILRDEGGTTSRPFYPIKSVPALSDPGIDVSKALPVDCSLNTNRSRRIFTTVWEHLQFIIPTYGDLA